MTRKCKGESGFFLKIYLTFVNSALLVFVIGLLMYVFNHEDQSTREDEKILNLLKIMHNILSPNLKELQVWWLPYLILVATCSVVVVSFLGCCGACSENICFIGFHGILSLLFLLFEILIVVVFITHQNEIWASTTSALQYSVKQVYNSSSATHNLTQPSVVAITRNWDMLQIRYNCCGVLGPEDYRNSLWFNSTNDSEAYFVPISCCINSDLGDSFKTPSLSSPFPFKAIPSSPEYDMCQIDAILFPRFNSHRRSHLRRRGCKEIFEEVFATCQPIAIMTASILFVIHVINSIVSFRLIHWLRQRFGDISSYCNEDSNEDT